MNAIKLRWCHVGGLMMRLGPLRFAIIAFLVGAAVVSPSAAQTANPFQQDFAVAIRAIADAYAYLDEKATRWNEVPALYAEDLRNVESREGLIRLLERVVEELYDHHAQLTVNLANSPRLVPSGADLWAEWRDGQAIVTQVRDGSDAQRAGLKPGAVVVALDGVSIADAVETRLGRSYRHSVNAARDWALRAVLAGRRNSGRLLEVVENGTGRMVELAAPDQLASRGALLDAAEIRRGVGYVRFHDSLGDAAVVAEFDRALERLRRTRALIIDLRDTPSGGNSTVARGILGRFVRGETAYQKHALPPEERATGVRRSWLELVSPRGDFIYAGRVAVLVNRWTGSMGEGLAIGFDATGAGTVVGTAMAGLLGATTRIVLPHSGIGINVPAERLYHVNGTPREKFQPGVLVDVASADVGGDPHVDAALRVLMAAPAARRGR